MIKTLITWAIVAYILNSLFGLIPTLLIAFIYILYKENKRRKLTKK